MNYRHAFHAGNFADCMKHALLVALLRGLTRKPTPFFVLETHAGAGHYDLASEAALRGNEAAGGIMRLRDRSCGTRAAVDRLSAGDAVSAEPDPALAAVVDRPPAGDAASVAPDPALAEYVSLVDRSGLYPGSPELIRALLRPDDRLACCELHPDEHTALRRLFRDDRQVAVHRRDGWEALKALLPPVQKRGLVFIDPPYENPDEFRHLADGLALARSRFPAAVLAAWYPIKHRAPVRAFFAGLRPRDMIAAELLLRAPLDPTRLNGCGLLVVNPPYQFEQVAETILRALLPLLGNGEAGEAATVTRLADE
jgi:23S rRNA (adenine2030-N6)-methyltransferase